MGTNIAKRITTNPLGLKSVDRSGFIRFGRRRSSKETLTDDKEEEEEEEGIFIIRSMDRFLEKQTAESIRQTMQAQEDIFKQQVRELHRVYNTQKMLMNQLKHRSQYRTHLNNKDQTSSRERTGSCSGIDLENMVKATQTATDVIEESELELTLSIGLSSSSTTKNNKEMERSSSDNCNNQSNNDNNSNNNQESSGPTTNMSSSSTTSLDRDKKRPHWLFRELSINRTSS